MEGWWRWALVSLDGVAPSQVVSVSASANFPLHNKVQKSSSGTGSPGWSQKKGCKTVVEVVVVSANTQQHQKTGPLPIMSQKVSNISQESIATCTRGGEIFSDAITIYSTLSLKVKDF